MNPLTQLKRLQGTDGIRGPIARANQFQGIHPLEVWIHHGFLTEEFFELYAFSFSKNLLDSGWAKKGDSLVIGWDTRDTEGIFNAAAINGIRKAGLTAVVVGVMPTPGICLYQLSRNATAALALTASHNPPEHNGIKIFLGHTGLKLFPEDDQYLTETCFKTNLKALKQESIKCVEYHEEEKARDFFLKLTLDPLNSWLKKDTLDGLTLVIDAANGAFCPILDQLGQHLGGARLLLCNNNPDRGINFQSGVADLEGLKILKKDELEKEPFCHAEALQTLVKEGRQQRELLLSGESLVMGLVLDGDGDRCFLLAYEPQKDCILVINGDSLAIIQAIWLKEQHKYQKSPLFVNTVESDLQSCRTAVKAGYSVNQSAVGDKWILWHAILCDWELRSNLFQKNLKTSLFKKMLQETQDYISQMEQNSNFNALKISMKLKQVEQYFEKTNADPEIMKGILDKSTRLGQSRFMLGYEESGHLLNLTRVYNNKNQIVPGYAGNGLKTGLNTLAAIQSMRPKDSCFLDWHSQILPVGFSKSLSIYHINKSLMEPNSEFLSQLKDFILKNLIQEGLKLDWIHRPEEPQMLYGSYSEKQLPIFSIFIRNSGTEDKIGLYLRGISNEKNRLERIGSAIYAYLLKNVKDMNKPATQAERFFLAQLKDSPCTWEKLIKPQHLVSSPEEIFRLMHTRQSLISSKGSKWELTSWGIDYIHNENDIVYNKSYI